MNAKQLYLGYVRTAHPKLYWMAVSQMLRGPKAGLAGLGDDLTSSITPVSIDTSTLDVGGTEATQAAIDAANQTPSSDSSWGDFFNNLTNAITTLAPTVINAQAQENLLKTNTALIQAGKPPVTANGIPVTAQMLAPTNQTLAQFEANLAQNSSWILPVALIGGLAFVLSMRKKR